MQSFGSHLNQNFGRNRNLRYCRNRNWNFGSSPNFGRNRNRTEFRSITICKALSYEKSRHKMLMKSTPVFATDSGGMAVRSIIHLDLKNIFLSFSNYQNIRLSCLFVLQKIVLLSKCRVRDSPLKLLPLNCSRQGM